MSFIAYTVIHMNHITPLDHSAPLDRFSEARALDHIRKLSVDIEGRQEGKKGLEDAADYIKGQLLSLKDRAGSQIKVEIDEALVSGSFNMTFLGRSIALGYRNHKNIMMRISSTSSTDRDTSILVNAHFDSPLGSPGAGDCGSCVASLLELARLVVDSSWVPPRPLIFLFNGAEELFLLGAHGFVTTHKWSDSVGAFINLEASGTGGLDLVVQSGPGTWPSHVYVQSAKHPMANSAAQDVFGVVPGDTDYRIFAEDHGNIPGLDIIFILGGYYYHTKYDTIERLMPGSIQARGDNMFNLIKAFASSPMMLTAEKASLRTPLQNNNNDRAIFFDYLSLFMVYYSRKAAVVLHMLPVVIFFLMSMFTCSTNISLCSWFATFTNMLKGVLYHAVSVVLAVIIPVVFSVVRLLFSSHAMSWFANPYLAFAMFVPSAVIGLLIPRTFWGYSHDSSHDKALKEALSDEAHFWGAFGLYAFITMAYVLAGLGGGFLTFFTSVSMIPAWLLLGLARKKFGNQTLKALAGYLIPLLPCLTYNVYFGGFLVQFLIEKMGMMGSLPPPYGYFIPDIIVAAVVGAVTGLCVGPVIPVAGRWLAKSSILQFLMQLTVIVLALSSQFFPYSVAAPKRVVLQHKILTSDSGKIMDSTYEFSMVDANSIDFLFKNVPEVANFLEIGSNVSFTEDNYSEKSSWVVLFPVSFLFTGSMKFPAKSVDILKQYEYMPHLSIQDQDFITYTGRRRVHLELSQGSLGEIWVTVLNITGPLTNWSFANNKLPAPESDGGPPSYILRLSGKSLENWTFWLEASSSEALRVDLAILDQYLVNDTQKLKDMFPDWIDVTAFSTFFSSYTF